MSEPVALESARNGAVEAYIEARPQLDSIHNRRIFEAGFDRGWLSTRREIERKDAAIAELVGALKGLMGWQVKNVNAWHNRPYDNAAGLVKKYDIPKAES